ncbi:MAG: signal peptidase I [Bacilli bacterium]|nr:signal peptidase I [Bacilli bacterium]MDD4608443.1 signal peptidase I [Bacilli bacterium]
MKLLKEVLIYILIIVGVILVRTYLITPVIVKGNSMYPTLDDKEVLLLKKYDHSYNRFDIVVFINEDSKLVKRVIGLPGEHIKYVDNKLYINGKQIDDVINESPSDFDLNYLGYQKIPEGMYFVLGDNRSNSVDSRMLGLIEESRIIGTTNFSLFPFTNFGKINK